MDRRKLVTYNSSGLFILLKLRFGACYMIMMSTLVAKTIFISELLHCFVKKFVYNLIKVNKD